MFTSGQEMDKGWVCAVVSIWLHCYSLLRFVMDRSWLIRVGPMSSEESLWEGRERVSIRGGDVTMEADTRRRRKGPRAKGCGQPLAAGKGPERNSLLVLLEGTSPADTLTSVQWNWFGLWVQNSLQEIKLVLSALILLQQPPKLIEMLSKNYN